MTAANMAPSQRLVFANQLRGLAALMVVVSHLIGIFWADPALVSQLTATPAQPGPTPWIAQLVAQPWFNAGPFGVAIFFLISGLVIPISLERHARDTFLAARALRIYPTYLTAFALGMATVWWASRHFGQGFDPHWTVVLGNAFLLQNTLRMPSLDPVNWTLLVEVEFYLLMACVAPAIRRGSIAVLFRIAIVLAVASLAFGALIDAGYGRNVPVVSFLAKWGGRFVQPAAPYLIFMLIGVLFHHRLRGQIATGPMLLSIAGLGVLFGLCWWTGPITSLLPLVPINYAYALLLFGALYALRQRIRPFQPLDALAAVSFPLYVIHALVGYTLLRVLMIDGGLGYDVALVITLAALLLIASGLHLTVEAWSIRAGRRLSCEAGKAPS